MSKHKNHKATAGCPVGKFFMSLETIFGATSEMSEHLNKSQLELLKAIRTVVDGRIENLEKKHASKRKKRMTKIKVE